MGLLAIDIGNTNTVLGLYNNSELVATWRIRTIAGRTADEYSVLISNLMANDGYQLRDVNYGALASVVPPASDGLLGLFEIIGVQPLVVGPGIRTGMPILYDDPREVGADRIVNAVAAYEAFGDACVVVDFGTATTWDVVSAAGEYVGGAIAPGIGISSEALYANAARLPRIDIMNPGQVIGKTTVQSMQAGIVLGHADMVDGMIDRIETEIRSSKLGTSDMKMRCMATGGMAPMIANVSRRIENTDTMLTLTGLRLLFERNR